MFTNLLLGAALAPLAALATDDSTQIHWERSYEDAMALVRQEGRPLLIAVNMDAEAASEHYANRRYHQPEFVASTRPFVCVVANPIRHTPLDYDPAGRRIPCPRLGVVTCGEHIAIADPLFANYMTDQQVAPRHILVTPEGEKAFDHYLLFDLNEVDRSIAEAATKMEGPRPTRLPSDPIAALGEVSHRAREVSEAAFRSGDRTLRLRMLDEIQRQSPISSVDILREAILLPDPQVSAKAVAIVEAAAVAKDAGVGRIEPHLRFTMVWERDRARRQQLLMHWSRVAPAEAWATRVLLSMAVDEQLMLRTVAVPAVRARVSEATWNELSKMLANRHEILSIVEALRASADRSFVSEPPWANVPSLETCERLLDGLDRLSERHPDDAMVLAERGRAMLFLAERQVLDGGNPSLVLTDAVAFLRDGAEGLAGTPEAAEAHLLAARAAFLKSEMDAMAENVLAAWRAAVSTKNDGVRIEASRMLGDHAVRTLYGDAEIDEVGFTSAWITASDHSADLAGLRAMQENDWLRLADLLGWIGRRGDQANVLLEALMRFPASFQIHGRYRDLLLAADKLEEVRTGLDRVCEKHPEDATAEWFAGYALVLEGEWRRKALDWEAAIRSYAEARARFERSMELSPDFEASVREWLARIECGVAFAHLGTKDFEAATDAFVQAVTTGVDLSEFTDGLDRNLQDLVDALLEARAVEPLDLFEQLQSQGAPVLALDRLFRTCFREAYRARGRNEEELAGKYFVATWTVLETLPDLEGPRAERRARDRMRAMLEVARVHVRDGDMESALELLARALESGRPESQGDELQGLLQGWLEELGPSRSFVRVGR